MATLTPLSVTTPLSFWRGAGGEAPPLSLWRGAEGEAVLGVRLLPSPRFPRQVVKPAKATQRNILSPSREARHDHIRVDSCGFVDLPSDAGR